MSKPAEHIAVQLWPKTFPEHVDFCEVAEKPLNEDKVLHLAGSQVIEVSLKEPLAPQNVAPTPVLAS